MKCIQFLDTGALGHLPWVLEEETIPQITMNRWYINHSQMGGLLLFYPLYKIIDVDDMHV